MTQSTYHDKNLLDLLTPLPLPEEFKDKSFRFSAAQQLGLAFMLNILSLAVPIMMLQVYDRIIPHASYEMLQVLTVGVLVALAVDAFLRVMRSWLAGWAAATAEYTVSNAALSRFMRSDIASFEHTGSGEHMQNLGAISRLREFYNGQALISLIDLPFAMMFIALVWYVGGILAIIPLTLLLLFAVCAILSGKTLQTALKRRHDNDDIKSNIVISILTGMHSVKALGLESSLLRKYEQNQNRVTNDSYYVSLASGQATILSAGFGQACLILTATAGCILVLQGSLSVGGLSACILLAGRAIQPLQRALGTWLRLQDLGITRAQVHALFEIKTSTSSSGEPYLPPVGQIELRNLSHHHEDQLAKFEGISLSIRPGDAIAISGDKSSGKSTLLQIMAGVLPPASGSVSVDGLHPGEFSMASLSKHIGYLPQEGTIFRGTILENITGFRNDEASIVQALQASVDLGLDQVVDALPQGYETPLTDNVADPVPPGVKQRIALARVLMHRPKVLLFDNADRALDKEGYNRLFRMIGRLKGSCTLIIVSDDQNLLSFCDKFYVLENGRLEESEPPNGSNVSLLSHMTGSPYYG